MSEENILPAEVETDWRVLLKMLPVNWRALAASTKAISRRPKGFKSEEDVLRAILLHVAGGYSLRETVARLKIANIANVSDVTLLKRLRCSEVWLRELCLHLLYERSVGTPSQDGTIKMRLVDGTIVKEPGKTGSQWRIHYSLLLPDLTCDYFKLTETTGRGTGESFKQFPVSKNDCIIGDRGYSTAQGLVHLASKGAYALVRVNYGALQFYTKEKQKFDLFSSSKSIENEFESREFEATVLGPSNEEIVGRICVIRKSRVAAELAIKKMISAAKKAQKHVCEETIEFAKYVIVFTTLPADKYPLNEVLNWYRIRWQIELVFKRLKSLAELGHLPKHDEASSRAWLYGKLLTGLLIEKLIRYAKSISPWGYL